MCVSLYIYVSCMYISIYCIGLHASKEEMCSPEVGAVASVFEKSAIEIKHKQKLF